MNMYEEAVLDACEDLLPKEVLNTTSISDLLKKYKKLMGYYYAIMSTYAMNDKLHSAKSVKSEDWPGLYSQIKEDIQFRPKYKINPQFYYDWVDDTYKVAFGSKENQIRYSYKHLSGSRFVASYRYTEEGVPVPYLILLEEHGSKTALEFEIMNSEIRDSVTHGLANVTQSNRFELKEVELIGLVADSLEMISVYKLGPNLESRLGLTVDSIEPSYGGECIALY